MKKTTLLSLLFALATVAVLQAQTNKGNFAFSLHNFVPSLGEAGGLLAPTNAFGIGFTTSKSETDGVESDIKVKNTTIGLSGSAHYFLIDNLSAGINLNLFNQKQKEEGGVDPDEISVNILMAGPELRYYFPAGDKMKIYVMGGAGFGTSSSKYNGDDDDDPTKLSRFGGSAGVAFFPNSNVSIDLGLGYSSFVVKNTYDDFQGNKIDSKDTNSGVALEVGFTVFL